jgi:hypothetical protein
MEVALGTPHGPARLDMCGRLIAPNRPSSFAHQSSSTVFLRPPHLNTGFIARDRFNRWRCCSVAVLRLAVLWSVVLRWMGWVWQVGFGSVGFGSVEVGGVGAGGVEI